MASNSSPLYFAILAGGEPNCYGLPKITAEFHEEPMIFRILSEIMALKMNNDPVYLSVKNRDQWRAILSVLENMVQVQVLTDYEIICKFAQDEELHVEAIYDSTNEHEFSPIFGLYSIFQQIVEGTLLLIPANLPYFNHLEIEHLLAIYKQIYDDADSPPAAIVPKWETGDLEPFIAYYTVDLLLDEIEMRILDGAYQLYPLLEEIPEILLVPIEEIWEDPSVTNQNV